MKDPNSRKCVTSRIACPEKALKRIKTTTSKGGELNIKILRVFVMENSIFESFDFVVIHNDAGRMKPKRYISF